jgi:alkylhydroperoxidase family enzyme
MSEPRILPVDPPYSPEIQKSFDLVMRGAPPLLLFRTIANNPRVLERMMAGGLLDRGSISLRWRELMILRTCALCGAEYEWGVHIAGFGEKALWTQDQIYSSVHGSYADGCWTIEEKLIIRLADELHNSSQVADSTWIELSDKFSPDQLVEFLMLGGLYHGVSFIVNACKVQPEAFAPKFPSKA